MKAWWCLKWKVVTIVFWTVLSTFTFSSFHLLLTLSILTMKQLFNSFSAKCRFICKTCYALLLFSLKVALTVRHCASVLWCHSASEEHAIVLNVYQIVKLALQLNCCKTDFRRTTSRNEWGGGQDWFIITLWNALFVDPQTNAHTKRNPFISKTGTFIWQTKHSTCYNQPHTYSWRR